MASNNLGNYETVVGEKALRYKRNVLVVSFILIVVALIPDLPLSKIPLLGASLGGNNPTVPHAEVIAWAIGGVVLGYNGAAYYSYGMADYYAWEYEILTGTGIPKLIFILKGIDKNSNYITTIGGDDKFMQYYTESRKPTNTFTNYIFRADDNSNMQKEFRIYDDYKYRIEPVYNNAYRYEFLIPATFATVSSITIAISLANEVYP